MTRLLWITAIGWLAWATASSAWGGVRFERMAERMGAAAVNHIMQDRLGFLWLATAEGLKKYDGRRLTVYRHEPFDSASLSSNDVRLAVEDRSGYLWLVAGGALNRFDRQTERALRFDAAKMDAAAVPPDPLIVFCDRSGSVWVGDGSKGLYRYRPESGDFERFSHNPENGQSLSDNQITAIFQTSSGELWIATLGGGLNRYNPYLNAFDRFLEDDGLGFDLGYHNIPRNPNNPPIVEDDFDQLWIATYGGGLVRFNPNDETFVQYLHDPDDPQSLGSNIVYAIFRDSRGLIWLATADGGVDRFDPEIERFQRFRSKPGAFSGFPTDARSIAAIAEDANGNLWFGGRNFGAAMFERGPERFLRFTHEPGDPHSLSADSVNALFVDRADNLWVGAMRGADKYSPYKQKFRLEESPAFLAPDGQPHPIAALVQDADGDLWVGSQGGGLVRYDLRSGLALRQYRHDLDDPGSLSNDYVNALLADDDGVLWAGTRNGLNRLEPGATAFQRFFRDYRNPDTLRSNDIRALYLDEDGRVWVGSERGGLHRFEPETQRFLAFVFERSQAASYGPSAICGMADGRDGQLWVAHEGGGLHRVDKETGEARHFVHDIHDPASISHDRVSCVWRDSEGRVWVGALGGGLNLFQPQTGGFRHFTRKSHGLADNDIYDLAEDAEGRLWLSLNNGLAVFEPASETFENFDSGDGLLSNAPQANALHRGARGDLFFGGLGGFNFFDPLQLPRNPHPPPVAVTELQRMGQTIYRDLANDVVVPLSYRDAYFSISFAALDFTYPAKNRFAYKLEGFDRDWIYKDEGKAEYTNLGGGVYRFRVKAANSDGVWNEAGLAFTVDIAPPFWLTWWFITIVILAGGFGIAWAFVQQRQRLQSQKRDELARAALNRKLQELEYARELQLSMLPQRNFESESLDVHGLMRTAEEVGGDFYDFFALDEDRFCVIIGDATGHGLAAGLVVGMTKMGSSVWAQSGRLGLADMLKEMNKALKSSLRQKNMGMGMGAAIIDTRTLQVELAFTGMPYPYHFRARDGALRPLVMKGPPLGFLSQIEVQTHRVALAPGDCLVFLSDGIPERFNDRNQLWGARAMEKNLRLVCQGQKAAAAVAEHLLAACDRWANGRFHDDDMTVVALRVKQRADQDALSESGRGAGRFALTPEA